MSTTRSVNQFLERKRIKKLEHRHKIVEEFNKRNDTDYENVYECANHEWIRFCNVVEALFKNGTFQWEHYSYKKGKDKRYTNFSKHPSLNQQE